MKKMYRVSDPKRIGIHIEPRPNLEVFAYMERR